MADETIKKEPLNVDTNTWEGMLNSFLIWVAKDPWTFLGYVAVILAPMLLISASLSWKLAKTLEKEEKNKVPLRRSKRISAKADWNDSNKFCLKTFQLYISAENVHFFHVQFTKPWEFKVINQS